MRVFPWLAEERVVFETPGILFVLVRCFSLLHSPVHDIDTCFLTSNVFVLVYVPQPITVILRIIINVTALDTVRCVQLCLL